MAEWGGLAQGAQRHLSPVQQLHEEAQVLDAEVGQEEIRLGTDQGRVVFSHQSSGYKKNSNETGICALW